MAELVDAPDLGSGAERCESSSLSWGTKLLFHDSTEVVQLTVNQLVPGSIPGRGANSFGW